MKKIKVLFVLLALLMLHMQGCKRMSEIDVIELTELAGFDVDDETYILVVPQNGCSTCVKKSYEFILKNWESPKIKYVFTHYSSKKAIRIRFKVLGIEDPSPLSYIDLGPALELGISQLYPSLVTLDENGEGSMIYMNAKDGSDWKELQQSIGD